MKHTPQLEDNFNQISANQNAKTRQTNNLHSLLSTLTTAIQINTILAILISIAIPVALKMQIYEYIILIIGVLLGFSTGVGFAIVTIQRYVYKLITKAK